MFGRKILAASHRLLKTEAGAITVDWVVLCAMVIALCLLLFAAISGASDYAADSTATIMREKPVSR